MVVGLPFRLLDGTAGVQPKSICEVCQFAGVDGSYCSLEDAIRKLLANSVTFEPSSVALPPGCRDNRLRIGIGRF